MKIGKEKFVNYVIWVMVFVVITSFNVVITTVYSSNYYKTSDEAKAVVANGTQDVSVTTSRIGDVITTTFAPVESDNQGDARRGLIFYPGGKVEYTAYAPLMLEIARRGYTCYLVEMPFNLAMFDANAASTIIKANGNIDSWYIGGHSLGGVFASMYADRNTDKIRGVLYLGSYSTKYMGGKDLQILSVRGTQDKVLNLEKYNESFGNFGDDFTEVVIKGGCHSYFGDYGMQEGDGEPTITRADQMKTVADWVALRFR